MKVSSVQIETTQDLSTASSYPLYYTFDSEYRSTIQHHLLIQAPQVHTHMKAWFFSRFFCLFLHEDHARTPVAITICDDSEVKQGLDLFFKFSLIFWGGAVWPQVDYFGIWLQFYFVLKIWNTTHFSHVLAKSRLMEI